jgi:hypothetical protein
MSLDWDQAVNESWKRRACPICGSLSVPSLPNSMAKKPAEKMSFVEVKSYFIGLRHDQIFFSYFRCLDCELLYCPWYFTKEQIAILYSEMPDNTMGEDKSTISRTQSAYAKWILQDGVNSRAYLEVGPDIGLLIRKIVSLQTPRRAAFIEPNSSVQPELIESVREISKVEIVDFVENLQSSDFTLIVGIHVFDHLLDPIQDLIALRQRANNGAHISIVVHNEKSKLRQLLNSKWPPFCLQHPQLYNPKTLENLLHRSGWTVQKINKSTNWYHLRYLAQISLTILGLKDYVSQILPNVEVPIRVGNIITLAQKSSIWQNNA